MIIIIFSLDAEGIRSAVATSVRTTGDLDVNVESSHQNNAYTSGIVRTVHLHRLLASGALARELVEILVVQCILVFHVHADKFVCTLRTNGYVPVGESSGIRRQILSLSFGLWCLHQAHTSIHTSS